MRGVYYGDFITPEDDGNRNMEDEECNKEEDHEDEEETEEAEAHVTRRFGIKREREKKK